jgi:peptidoglycan/LPS O-acetylase OafA/YrhL
MQRPLSIGGETKLVVVEAMRGLAALMVVLYHARAEFWIGIGNSWAANGATLDPGTLIGYASYPLSYGWFGVQVFFLLSGYCIHRRLAYQLAADPDVVINWCRFFIRRFLRIYPVYISALVLTALIDGIYLSQGGAIGSNGAFSWSAFLSSILTLQGFFEPMFGTNTVFWTLSIEVHLYLFYPLIFSFNRNAGAGAAILLSFIASAAYIGLFLIFDWSRYFPYAHGGGPVFLPFVFMWAAGAYLADAEAGRAHRPGGILWFCVWITALVGGFVVHVLTNEVVSALPLAVGATGLVLWAMQMSLRFPAISARILPPLAWLGACSYSLYATHRIVFGVINTSGFEGQSASVGKFIVATLLAVLFARLFYLMIERASLNLSARWRTRGLLRVPPADPSSDPHSP